ncbi:indole-3-glycerol phosphate synthase [Marinithermofilum abyssi]|uniref:Indole-3-glycerol phosphate synthase n=1 Tax=Marinithermofilum abyssi TaxID=1571185 RepID=A0A8J2VFQ2_9BACL|nr:indole-3-glycerol phosphate synthase TrpC [Marinithermofilum abyssi]GGE11347.1 indole-3-glycerol phosphate synthase [Marinithermofilum abyssi]
MFLKKIAETKEKEVAQLAAELKVPPQEVLEQLPACRSLSKNIQRRNGIPALIAEVKPASPSKGVIREQVDPQAVAFGYEKGGAHAVSVLTDRSYFKGDITSLEKVKESVSLPVLRKDFIIHPLQVVESRLRGADAILLIAALLEEEAMRELSDQAHALGMEVLIEVHNADELPRALAGNPDVLGINNRDLHSFETDLAVTETVLPRVPKGIPVIGESGVLSAADFHRLARAGVDGVLVGEYLMRQGSPEEGVRSLLEGEYRCAPR